MAAEGCEMKKPKRYYSLFVCNESGWGAEFGDYDKSAVEFERDDYLDHGHKRKNLKIVCTGDTQEEINKASNKLNSGGAL